MNVRRMFPDNVEGESRWDGMEVEILDRDFPEPYPYLVRDALGNRALVNSIQLFD